MDEFRLSSISEFVGQDKLINRLKTHIKAAVAEKRPLEHTLLAGRPGFGKTTLATLIADLLDDPLETLIMPVSDKTLQAVVTNHDGVLLLDELHAASNRNQEMLQPVLEFGYLQVKTGCRLPIGFLTIVGATTRPQDILGPLYDRFKIKPVFEDYTEDQMGEIVLSMSLKAGLDITEDDAIMLGQATAGTPRNASQFILAGNALRHELDRTPTAGEILTFCDTDTDGLDRLHYKYLETLARFGGSRGLAQIATVMRLSPAIVMEIEVPLYEGGFIDITSSGRELLAPGRHKVHTPRSGRNRGNE